MQSFHSKILMNNQEFNPELDLPEIIEDAEHKVQEE
jgi:hypothetical protein